MEARGRKIRERRRENAQWKRVNERGRREALKRGFRVRHTYRNDVIEPGVIAIGSTMDDSEFTLEAVYHPVQDRQWKYYRSVILRTFHVRGAAQPGKHWMNRRRRYDNGNSIVKLELT